MKFRRFAAAALATATLSAGVAAPASAQNLGELGALLTVLQGGKEAIAKMDCGTSGTIQRAVGGTKDQTRTQYSNLIKSKASALPVGGTIAASLSGDIANKALECGQVKPDPAPRNPIEALLRSSSESPLAAFLPAELTDLTALSSNFNLPK